jgi:hypothetical protein
VKTCRNPRFRQLSEKARFGLRSDEGACGSSWELCAAAGFERGIAATARTVGALREGGVKKQRVRDEDARQLDARSEAPGARSRPLVASKLRE